MLSIGGYIMKLLFTFSFLFFILLNLSACGGGGGAPPPESSSDWDTMVWDQDNWD